MASNFNDKDDWVWGDWNAADPSLSSFYGPMDHNGHVLPGYPEEVVNPQVELEVPITDLREPKSEEQKRKEFFEFLRNFGFW